MSKAIQKPIASVTAETWEFEPIYEEYLEEKALKAETFKEN